MAVNIETAQQLQDVLDAIYNNREQYDTYQNLTLYYNDITRTATIFTVDGEEAQESTKNVIAVFNPENIVTNNNAFFVTLMKSATVNVSTEETSVYDFALGGYVDVNTLLKNICVALGVSLSGTFADANPALYSDMINIIRNEYGQSLENNAPYIMKKFVNVSTQEETYKSLVPLMCIVRIAMYLSNLGIFNTGDYDIQREITMSGNTYLTGICYDSGWSGTLMQRVYDDYNIDYPTFDSLGMEIRDKDDFVDFIRKYYTQTIYDNQAPLITNNLDALTKFLDQYESEIDWTHFILLYWVQTTSTATNTETVYARTIPSDKVVQISLDKRIGSNVNYGLGGVGGPSNTSLVRIIKDDDTPTYTFSLTVSHDNTTQEDTITHNKSVSSYTKGFRTTYYSNSWVFNTKPTKYVKPYCNTDSNDWYSLSGQLIVRFVDHFNKLTYNTEYKDLALCYDVKYLMPYLDKAFLENNNFELHVGDLLYVARSNNITNYIILREANVKGFTFNNILTYAALLETKGFVSPPVKNIGRWINNAWTTYPQHPILATAWINENDSYNFSYQNINFSEPITIDIFKMSWDSSNYTVTVTTDQLTNQSSFNFYTYFNNTSFTILGNNMFQVVDIEQESTVEGITLLPGSTYPKNVIDLNSFNKKYPDWFKTQSNNPQIVNGVLAPTVTSTQWGAVSISKTTPTTQEDSEGGDIDFTNPEDVQDIIDDVDNANEDNDIDTSATTEGDETNGGSDEGYTPEVPADSDLPQLVGSRVYVLNPGAASGLMASLSNPDMWQNIAGGDLTRYIVSLQQNQCWDGNGTQKAVVVGNLEAQYQSQGKTYSVNGYEISGVDLYTNFDFGYVDIPYHFHNYLDITNTKLTLYLPYVGYVDLDISEFIGRKLGLEAKVYLPTGDLIYYISSLDEESNQKQIKATFSSNCSQEVPVAANTSILNSFKNSINYGNWIGTVKDAIGL